MPSTPSTPHNPFPPYLVDASLGTPGDDVRVILWKGRVGGDDVCEREQREREREQRSDRWGSACCRGARRRPGSLKPPRGSAGIEIDIHSLSTHAPGCGTWLVARWCRLYNTRDEKERVSTAYTPTSTWLHISFSFHTFCFLLPPRHHRRPRPSLTPPGDRITPLARPAF